MAFFDTHWYCNFGNGTSTGYYAVPQRQVSTAYVAGQMVRQNTTPIVGEERVFICTIAGTTSASADTTGSWNKTRGATTLDGTARWWECTGIAALNGDATNTRTWAECKAIGGSPSLGVVIKRNNGASYQYCTNAISAFGASEPAFSDTAGVTTAEGSTTWTSLGPVSNFTGGMAPHARLATALTSSWFASGNTVYVGNNHAETQSTGMTLNPGSALLAKVLCHSASGSYPPTALATGATVTTTGGSGMNLTMAGSFYFYGITFSCATSGSAVLAVGASSVAQVHNWYYFDNCSLQLGTTTGTSTHIQIGNNAAASWAIVVFNNTTVKFGATGQDLNLLCVQFTWRNTGQVLASGSSIPATLLQSTAANLATVLLEALDLSQLTGAVWGPNTINTISSFTIKDCKLNATTTVTTPINTGMTVQLAQSDSGATSYKSSRHTYEAVETTETSIVRTGGYADPQAQAQSRKIVTTANTQWLRPYQAQPLAVWNATTGSSKTVTVYGTVNSASLPTNDEVWLEVSGLTDAGTPTSFATIFDGANSSQVTTSNGNLKVTVNNSTNNIGARSTVLKSTGKHYFEVTSTLITGNSMLVGLITTAGTYVNMANDGTNCIAVFPTGTILSNNTNTGKTLGAYVTGDVICFAVDLDARKAWLRKNGGNWNGEAIGLQDPVTGTGGVTVASSVSFSPAVAFGGGAPPVNEASTANFGATAFAQSVPSGFASGWATDATGISPRGSVATTTKSNVLATGSAGVSDSSTWGGGGSGAGWSPFKLVATLTPQMPGYLIPQVKVAKASTTVYLDPLAVVT